MSDAKTNKRIRLLLTAVILAVFIGVIGVSIYFVYCSPFELSGEQSNHEDATSQETASETAKEETENEVDESAIEPITPEEAYAHAKIVATTDAQTSPNNLTEADVSALLAERGFGGVSITTNYELDGSYHSESNIDAGSSVGHPTYEATYLTEDGDYWVLLVYNGRIMANPLSYNFDQDGEDAVEVVLSETETVVSYDSVTNTFYEIIPDGTELMVKRVSRIDAETISEMSYREIDAL